MPSIYTTAVETSQHRELGARAEPTDLGCLGQPKSEQIIQTAQAAWQRLSNCQSWKDWLLVGDALVIGRAEAMSTAHSNKPEGRRYNEEFGCWLKANGFAFIDKSVRSRLLDCVKNRVEIETWRGTLSTPERLKLNHPNTVLRHWQRKTAIRRQVAITNSSPAANLKASIAALEEDNFRMKREIERGGGDLWSSNDTAKDIARVLFSQFSRSKASDVAQELTKLARKPTEAKTRPGHSTPDQVQ